MIVELSILRYRYLWDSDLALPWIRDLDTPVEMLSMLCQSGRSFGYVNLHMRPKIWLVKSIHVPRQMDLCAIFITLIRILHMLYHTLHASTIK